MSLRKILMFSALAIGCTTKPTLNPSNEINEPVFFRGAYLALGATAGAQGHNNTLDSTYHFGPLIEPWFSLSRNVSPWASYLVWPLYWSFLLTGEQHSVGSVLKTGKIHMAATIGMNSISYSQRDEWQFGAGVGLRAKVLFSPKVFSEAGVGLQLGHFSSLERGALLTHLISGIQLSPKMSLSISGNSTLYRADERLYYGNHGIAFYDSDVHNEIRARFRAYLSEKHILGPELLPDRHDLPLRSQMNLAGSLIGPAYPGSYDGVWKRPCTPL